MKRLSLTSRTLSLFPSLLLLPLGLLAQQSQWPVAASHRPKIGVALEGGGALGLAHIGVLRWFEEHRIPVDYIAGTSMGGLVGGLYATGMRAREIEERVSSLKWDDLLRGQPKFQDLSYRRKEDQRAFQNGLEFGLRNGFSLPSGLNTGQGVGFILDREALPYSNLSSFDDLPIPFRCVATDLSTGKAHVFESGPLGEALRATMSLPAVFTPIREDGSLYADGGLLDNLPVDVVKRMGADIVIAVHLTTAPYDSKQGQSMISVMNRSIGVMISANELRSMEAADLLISVDVGGYASSGYAFVTEIISKGYEGAARKSQLLAQLTVSEAIWQQHLQARESRRIRSTAPPEFVEVQGVGEPLAHDIEKALSDNVGRPLDINRLENDLNVISGAGRFSRFSYRMTELDGRTSLVVQGDEKEYAPPLLNLGFLIDGSEVNNVRWSMNARITAMDVGGYRSEWRTDVSAGSTWGLSSEYYKPLGATTRWFVAPRAYAVSNPFDLYDRSTELAEYRLRQYGGGFDVGYAISRFSEIRAGYDLSDFQSALLIGQPVLPQPSGRMGATSVRYSLDKLDSPVVPHQGELLRARIQWNDASPGAAEGFPSAELETGLVQPVSEPGSVYVQGFGGSTFGYHDTGIPQFFLGGPGRLSSYGTNELRTNQYYLGRLGYLHRLASLPPLLGNKIYFNSAYELGKAYGAPGAPGLSTDVAAGLLVETLFGPIEVGTSVGDTGHRKFYFRLGRFF